MSWKRIGFALVLAAVPLRAQQPAFHVTNYDIALTLPDAGKRIEGVVTLTVRRLHAADTLVLDLEDLKVDRVSHAGKPVGFTQDAKHVRIYVGGDKNDTLSIAVSYSGIPTDGLIIGTDSAGRWIGFGDNWPNRARHWIPSIDHPSDKSTVSFAINAPSDRLVVANGQLVETKALPVARDPDGSAGRPVARTLTRWRESRPIPVYLMTIAAAPLVKFDLGETACGFAEIGKCVPQQVYVAPEQRASMPGEFARAGDMVEFFARLVAPFPYEKLAHLQSSTRYGGMENASAIFYADRAFRGRGTTRGVIAHETAHQWFGDAVTEHEWGHVWLSEGFATYFEQLWTRHAFGDSAFREELVNTRNKIIGAGEVAARPVIDTAQADLMALLNTNSYEKGGWTLHMLRTTVGDSAFFRGIRDYWTSHRNANAVTDDLMVAVEKRSGTKLGWFFDQWLRRPGFASLTTGWRYDAATRHVVLDVEQGERFAPYRFTLAIDVVDGTGKSQRVKVEVPANKTAQLTLPGEFAAAPRNLVFDPDVELLAQIRAK